MIAKSVHKHNKRTAKDTHSHLPLLLVDCCVFGAVGAPLIGLRGCHRCWGKAATLRAGKMDSDVGRDGEEGYNLREMGSDGQGGWEEGGVDGSAGGGVSATAAAMEWSMSGVGGNSAWSVEKVCRRMGRMATSSGRWRMMGGEVGKRVVWMDRLGVVYPPQPQRWNGQCRG